MGSREEIIDEDPINHPSHYMLWPDTEAIGVIKLVLTEEEYQGYCKGNSLKYRLRAGGKDDTLQDIGKAKVYETWLEEEQ